MKFNIKCFTIVLLVFASCKEPTKLSIPSTSTMTVVSFTSICCGTRSDAFLKSFFETFKARNNAKLHAIKVTGCGKEGEYKILFGTGNLSAAMNQKFSEELTSLIEKEMKKSNEDQKGTVNIEVADSVNISYCRGGETAF